jgi:hypothetical protein
VQVLNDFSAAVSAELFIMLRFTLLASAYTIYVLVDDQAPTPRACQGYFRLCVVYENVAMHDRLRRAQVEPTRVFADQDHGRGKPAVTIIPSRGLHVGPKAVSP